MKSSGEIYYQKALLYFELEDYDNAVQNFIMAYDEGKNRENILENLYQCFVRPNEEEFRKNYCSNSKGISWLSYEQLSIDFIPVSDTKYYLFDKEKRNFIGNWDLKECESKEPQANSREFSSALVANQWDLRIILPLLQESNWQIVYLIMNQCMSRFASFLKLPN